MSGQALGFRSQAEVTARFDELFERHYPSTTPESAALLDRIWSSARAENRAAAAQLAVVGELFIYRLSRCSDTEEWASTPWRRCPPSWPRRCESVMGWPVADCGWILFPPGQASPKGGGDTWQTVS